MLNKSVTLQQAAAAAFEFPASATARKHGPQGYVNYQSYKPWLRDEFWFRCVYCLTRETWTPNGHDDFGVDHVAPQSSAEAGIDEYGNLVYSCSSCNRNRQDEHLPLHPTETALAEHLRVQSNGYIEHLTDHGHRIIDQCNLNRPSLVSFRRGMLRLLTVLAASNEAHHQSLLAEMLSLPASLPELSQLRPPGGNLKPDALALSVAARRRANEQAEYY